ncbi:MAG: hypothetical protein HY671_12845 [Chloroflexi bacterium]|nr:hypothetical protein [Chloroflexota bacterium]
MSDDIADDLQKCKAILQQWLREHQPFKFLLVSLPSVTQSERRWASFQVILSAVFTSVAVAVGILAIDISKVHGAAMAVAFFFLGLGGLGFMYAIWLGITWYNLRYIVNNDTEAKTTKAEAERVKRDDRLHEDMVSLSKDVASLVREMKADREGRNDGGNDSEQRG